MGDEHLIRVALEAAATAGPRDVPVGAAVFTAEGVELARAVNAREALGDPTAHAEILALRSAALALGDGWRLVFGAWEPKTGAVGSLWDVVRDRRLTHRLHVRGGVLADECAAPLEAFFARQR